ncbi:hypothetical protein LJB90_00750 [Eubacteriales bacterium OttesenSCG-928-G02]|nr:hypothetical protein [Eubacteriales bacterium OttesenSCG-928-G02]
MKKILTLTLVLVMLFALAVPTMVSAENNPEITIYKVSKAPVIDGTISKGEYQLIDRYPDLKAIAAHGYGEILDANPNSYSAEFYACYTDDAVYIAVKSECDEHVAYMDNDAQHYIFNAHHAMTMIIPDDPRKDAYKPTAADGFWTWSDYASAPLKMHEWTIIADSRPEKNGANDISTHVIPAITGAIDAFAGFEYKVKSTGGFDYYEMKIPFAAFKSDVQTEALTSKTGTIFGLGIAVGLNDVGTGYTTGSFINLSQGYANGGKRLQDAAVIILGGDYVEPVESSEVPTESSKGTTDTGDNGYIAIAIISLIALAGAVVVKKVR